MPGIRNLGNTCFLNATLQAILGVPCVFEAIRCLGDESQGEVVIIGDAWANGICEIVDSILKGIVVDPIALHRAMLNDWKAEVGGIQTQQYIRGQMMDAAEFATQLVERVAPLRALMSFSMQDTPPPNPPSPGYCSLPVSLLKGFSLQALVHVEYSGREDGSRADLVMPLSRVLLVELRRYYVDRHSAVRKDDSRITVGNELLIYSRDDSHKWVTSARFFCKGAVYHFADSPHEGHYVAE